MARPPLPGSWSTENSTDSWRRCRRTTFLCSRRICARSRSSAASCCTTWEKRSSTCIFPTPAWSRWWRSCRAGRRSSVACNALHALEARLCRWSLQTHDCVDGDAIPLTQEFLGQMLGVRRTTVTIAARLLQSAGLIRYRRGLIHIVDRAALEEISCECYAVVRHNLDRVFSAPIK